MQDTVKQTLGIPTLWSLVNGNWENEGQVDFGHAFKHTLALDLSRKKPKHIFFSSSLIPTFVLGHIYTKFFFSSVAWARPRPAAGGFFLHVEGSQTICIVFEKRKGGPIRSPGQTCNADGKSGGELAKEVGVCGLPYHGTLFFTQLVSV